MTTLTDEERVGCFDSGCVMTDDHSGMRTNGGCKCIENACANRSEARQIRRRIQALLQERRELRRGLGELVARWRLSARYGRRPMVEPTDQFYDELADELEALLAKGGGK
jgi:hypothetical protein